MTSHTAAEHKCVIIESPDTDVAVLCVARVDKMVSKNLMYVEVWFRTGTKDKRRYIPIHSLCDVLGAKICRALPGYHAITGCDSVSSLSRFGKKEYI